MSEDVYHGTKAAQPHKSTVFASFLVIVPLCANFVWNGLSHAEHQIWTTSVNDPWNEINFNEKNIIVCYAYYFTFFMQQYRLASYLNAAAKPIEWGYAVVLVFIWPLIHSVIHTYGLIPSLGTAVFSVLPNDVTVWLAISSGVILVIKSSSLLSHDSVGSSKGYFDSAVGKLQLVKKMNNIK